MFSCYFSFSLPRCTKLELKVLNLCLGKKKTFEIFFSVDHSQNPLLIPDSHWVKRPNLIVRRRFFCRHATLLNETQNTENGCVRDYRRRDVRLFDERFAPFNGI